MRAALQISLTLFFAICVLVVRSDGAEYKLLPYLDSEIFVICVVESHVIGVIRLDVDAVGSCCAFVSELHI